MSAKVDWFTRGRDAFTAGKSRHIQDARITGRDRNDFRRGWNFQARLNAPPRDPVALTEALAELRDLRNSL